MAKSTSQPTVSYPQYKFEDMRHKKYKTLRAVNNVELCAGGFIQCKVVETQKGVYYNIDGDTYDAERRVWNHALRGEARKTIVEATEAAWKALTASK